MSRKLNQISHRHLHSTPQASSCQDHDRAVARLKAELTLAFAAPESAYRPLTAADVIVRNQS